MLALPEIIAMNAQEALQNAILYTDDVEYVMVGLPPNAIMAAAGVLAEIGSAFGTLIVDKDEVTLIITAELFEDFDARLPEARLSSSMRLITFDIVLPMDLVGFIALVGQLLAENGISIIPLGAFERDHLLVSAEDFDAAWNVLQNPGVADDD